MKKILLLFLLAYGMISCEKEEFIPVDAEKFIVESYIQPGTSVEVEISSIDDGLSSIPFFDSLSLSLDGVNYQLSFNPDGNYDLDDVSVLAGSFVELGINLSNGQRISSSTLVPEEPVNFTLSENEIRFPDFDFGGGIPSELPDLPEPIDITWETDDNLVFLLRAELTTPDAEPILEDADITTLERSFFVGPITDKFTSLAPNRFSFFGNYRIVLFFMREEYATVYENLNATTQVLNNPESNVENAFGIFTSFNSDTLNISVLRD